MAGSRWPEVVQALVTRMRATAGYCSPWATTTAGLVPVYHSVELDVQTRAQASQYVVFGWAGDGDVLEVAGRSAQTWGPMASTRPRNDEGTIRCAAVCQTGTGGEKRDGMSHEVLTACNQILADVDAMTRVPADGPSLGVVAPWLVAKLGERTDWRPVLSQGITWRCEFEITYTTRV